VLVRVSRPRSTRHFSGLFFAPAGHRLNVFLRRRAPADLSIELELELIQTQMTQKPMLRAEVGMRVRCANKTSAECIMRVGGALAKILAKIAKSEAIVGSAHSTETIKRKARERSS